MYDETDEDILKKLNAVQKYVKSYLKKDRLDQRIGQLGTYDPPLNSMTIDKDVDPDLIQLVIFHEVMHMKLGQTHWGESQRRLDHLQIMIASRLDILRGQLIRLYLKSILFREVTAQEIPGLMSDKQIQNSIRQVLSKNCIFMNGIRMLDDLEKKKTIFLNNWIMCQEGFAHWSMFDLQNQLQVSNDVRIKIEKFKEVMLNQMNEKVKNGFNIFNTLSKKLDGHSMMTVVHSCLMPNISKIDLIDTDFNILNNRLSAESISPDLRLLKFYKIIEQSNSNNIKQLMPIFDSDISEKRFLIDEFNEYWYDKVDAHPTVTTLIDNACKEAKIPNQYIPPKVGIGQGTTHSPDFFSLDILDENGNTTPIRKDSLVEDLNDVSTRVDALLRMAKSEDLID